MKKHEIIIYTDGAAKGNPGRGGFGVVLISGKFRKEISGGFRHTTNNRMELLSVIVGIESLKNEGSSVTVFSDSKYVVDSVEKKWVFGWEKKNFRKKMNEDLWKRFLVAFRKHIVKFIWVKGHADNKENNRCDRLAVEASEGKNLTVDEGYERSIEKKEADFNQASLYLKK